MAIASTLRRNNLGLLRLVFAMCVLVSHSIELVDGNRSREPLTYIFGTLSLGELGVDGFFLVSGYLIAQSFENSVSLLSYLWKRILRIYPAFIVAFVISIVVVGPLSGADMNALRGNGWRGQIVQMLLLGIPLLPNAFAGLHYRLLNGAMWTIPYEFSCYLIIGILGLLGLLRWRWVIGSVAFVLLLASAFLYFGYGFFTLPSNFAGSPNDVIRFAALFLCGTAFYLFRDSIPYRTDVAVVAAIALIASLFSHVTEELAVKTLGGYLIFWFAFLKNTPRLNRINNETDISYGIYLYAWPIQNLLIKFVPGITPLPVMILTTFLAAGLAYLSWRLIEKPSLSLRSIFAKKIFATKKPQPAPVREPIGERAAGPGAIDNIFDPVALLAALDVATPDYLGRVDRGELIYPACTRASADADGNLRLIWDHTRIEAMRYVMMVPRREVELLVDPARQAEMIEAFLRRRPHEDTVVDFTGVAVDDYSVAIIAGFNWLSHCAVLAGVDPVKFSRPLRNFRKIVLVAQRWWVLDGAGPRCQRMLVERNYPPLMVYLIWLEYTRLAKEIASTVISRAPTGKAATRDRQHFTGGLADPIPADPVVDALQPPTEASSPPVAPNRRRRPKVFAVSAGIIVLVVVVGISIALLIPRPPANSAPSAPSQADIQGREAQSNGLTKDTNDFLRQLSQHPPGPAAQ
jgi:peptidoglycan/LPS O-acetylase OafA/YrhL